MIIDNSLKVYIPALKQDEYAKLEQSIIDDGCRDPLVVWDGILIDGHNRYEICTKHGIHFDTKDMYFANHAEAKLWMLKNQLGRRNLSDYDRVQLALELENIYKDMGKANMVAGGHDRKKGLENSTNPSQQVNTRKEIAKIAGVSDNTVAKVKKINELGSTEVKQALAEGKTSINAAYNQSIGKVKLKSPQEDPQESSGPDEEEMQTSQKAFDENIESLQKIAGSDDKLAAALAEIKQLHLELATIKITRDGYMNKCNVLITTVKSLQRKLDKLGK